MTDETKEKLVDKEVRAFMAFARSIHPGWRANLLAKVCIALVKIIGPRKDIARRNIMLCFPEKTKTEREKILSDSYESMIWTGVELLAWQSDPDLIDRMVIEAKGLEYVDKALARGRGAVMFSAHLGSWELSAVWFGRRYPFHGVVRHSDHPFQRKLVETLRETGGLRTISKTDSMMRVITMLRKNETFGALDDQYGGGEGIKVPFFGQLTSTATGPAAFSVLTGAPMLPFSIKRLEPFKFTVEIGAPLTQPPKELKRDDKIRDLTIRMNQEYEKMIRANPGQWLWVHRRFREIIF